MTQRLTATRQHSNAYNIFILVLTVLSLAVMVVMLLPFVSDETMKLLSVYDNVICVIFLIDFYLNMRGAGKKSDYFIKERGWLDLLGSIPSLGLLTNVGKFAGLFRLARLSRLARIMRLLRGENKKALIKDVLENRSRYATFLTLLLTILVLVVASVLVLQFESQSPENANIQSGGDALWYAIVTITTVGYGDRYPVTTGGRITAMFIMFMGVGIIGALASILASLLVGGSPPEEDAPETGPAPTVEDELATIKRELAEMRHLLEKMSAGGDK